MIYEYYKILAVVFLCKFLKIFTRNPNIRGVTVIKLGGDETWMSFSTAAKVREGQSLEIIQRWKNQVLNRCLMRFSNVF